MYKKIKIILERCSVFRWGIENPAEEVFEKEPERILPYKNNSAPATSTINREYSVFAESVENKTNIYRTRKLEAKRQIDRGQRTQTSLYSSLYK